MLINRLFKHFYDAEILWKIGIHKVLHQFVYLKKSLSLSSNYCLFKKNLSSSSNYVKVVIPLCRASLQIDVRMYMNEIYKSNCRRS